MRKANRFIALPIAVVTVMSATGCSVLATPSGEEGGQLVYMNSGGVLLEAETAAFIDEFTKETGIEVVTVSPVDMAKIKTQVDAGRVDVDVVQWNAEDAIALCGTVLDEIGPDLDLSEISSDYIFSDCGVPAATFVHTYFYDSNIYGDNPPTDWADFFDTENFPGKRAIWNSGMGTNYEQALLGTGKSPDSLYPLDYDLALDTWESLGDNLSFWSTPAELVQLLQGSAAPMVSGWGPAATQAIRQGASNYVPVMSQPLFYANQYLVPKGAPNRAEALEFIQFVTSKQSQTALVSNYPEGPTNTTVDVTKFADDVLAKYSPSKFIADSVVVDPAWRGQNFDEMATRWNEWATQ